MLVNREQPTAVGDPPVVPAPQRARQMRGGRNQAPYDALILDAQCRQSLVAVRSLGRRGLRVAALETCGGVPTFVSRWCKERLGAPAFAPSPLPYLTYLEWALERAPGSVLIPSRDGTVDLLRQHRARLERRACLAVAQEPALATAINKAQTFAIARRLGVGVPRSAHVEGVSDLPAALHDIGLPAVIKPVESWVRGARGGNTHRLSAGDHGRGSAPGGGGADGAGVRGAIPDVPAGSTGGGELALR
jgi:predicted ATP-grasp superfamily ATP-dependent carboligase